MPHEGDKRPGLVPFPRFFAVLGYAAFWAVLILFVGEVACRILLPLYHYRTYPLVRGGPEARAQLSHRRGAGSWGAFFFDNLWFDMSSASPAYDGYDWAEDFWKEQRTRFVLENATPAPYEPFRVWGSHLSHGKYINVDVTELGALRRTVNALKPGCGPSTSVKVWVFGASTTWGYGTPDFATIPSYLSQKLNGDGLCAEVVNMGVDGYVTNQEAIFLMQELKAGRRPDVAVFVDGYSDAYVGAINPGIPSTHWDFDEIRAKHDSTLISWPGLTKHSYLVQVINGLRKHRQPAAGAGPTAGEIAARSRATMDNYEANLRVISLLAREYEFNAYYFWQPYVLYGNKPLVPFEKALWDDDAMHAVYEEADRRATASGKFVFLGRIYDDVKEPIYIDSVHLGPRGNELIADAIAKVIGPALAARSGKPEENQSRKHGSPH